LNIVCRTAPRRSGHDGAIRGAGGKIAERGAVLEEDYFYKKVNNRTHVECTNEMYFENITHVFRTKYY